MSKYYIYDIRDKDVTCIKNSEDPIGQEEHMDIYAYAKQIDYAADYMDPHTGYIYHIQEYGRQLKFFGIDMGIRVSDNGKTIGYARKDQ